jgi:hypothetical protein
MTETITATNGFFATKPLALVTQNGYKNVTG